MHILIADDDAGTRGIIRRVLTHDLKCEVTEAADGKQVLAAVEQHSFDAAIFDLQMPEMGGLEALAALRKSSSQADLPVIVLTADAGEQAVRQAAILGISAYLTKPINPARLSPRLKGILDQIARRSGPGGSAGAARADLELDASRPALVADADAGFRTMFAAALAGRLTVLEADNGFKVLQALMVKGDTPVPQMVLLGAQTGLLSGALLVDKIRKLQLTAHPRVVGVYPADQVDEVRRGGTFDAVLVRGTDGEQMLEQFDRLWGTPTSLQDLLERHPRFTHEVAADVSVVSRARWGVEFVADGPHDGPRLSAPVSGHVAITSSQLAVRLDLVVIASADDARALVAGAAGCAPAAVTEEQLTEGVTAFVTALAGRLEQRFSQLGLTTTQGAAEVRTQATAPPAGPGTAISGSFHTEPTPGPRLVVTLTEPASA